MRKQWCIARVSVHKLAKDEGAMVKLGYEIVGIAPESPSRCIKWEQNDLRRQKYFQRNRE